MKRKPPTKKFQEGGSVSGTTFRERQEIRNRERDRISAQREYESRRSAGVAERARQRQAAADEDRRQRMESERETRRQRLATSRAQADVERFNRPPRVVPYQERLPAAPPASEAPSGRAVAPQTAAGGGGAGGGGGGRAMVAAPGSSPMPRGGNVITGGRGLVQQRGIPIETPRFPASAPGLASRMLGPAGAALSALESTPANVGEREELARVTAAMQAEQDRRMNEADADSARTAPARVAPTPSPRPRPRAATPRESEADRLNEISLAFARGERPRGGAADNIGRALGIEGYKKGGLVGAKKPVKRAMGGSIPKPPAPPKPKVPGRKAGRPATAVKVPPRKAPTAPKMPAFKKGGKVTMKGKRK